ncbi:MAG: ABC transporter ATP-binding protein, partial [Clostridia bacterium]|nr:ABC transporter ATP-binding protein [Clostridia bacterium]
VGIVRALINSPEIHFADEPTGALNSKTGLDVLDTLTKFNEQGQSVVMVTHDMRSARRGNRILYLKDGVILGECNLGKYVHGDRNRHEKLSAFLKDMGW